jgi:hypothetical protein
VTLTDAPPDLGPTYWQTLAVALIGDVILLFVLVMVLLAICAHRRDKAEEDA